jgi:hypothetical protein
MLVMQINIKFSNRALYTLLLFLLIGLLGVSVYAVAGVSHSVDEMDLGPITISGDDVGIGTTGAIGKLGVGSVNNVYLSSNTINGMGEADENHELWLNYYGYNEGAAQFRDLKIGDGKANSILMVDGSAGNVGIGTTTPTQKLDVNGNIKGTQLCIGTDCRSSWPGGGTLSCTTEFIAGSQKYIACPSGYTMTGGGMRGSNNWVDATYPSGNGWQCNGAAAHGCYVRCCRIV